MSEIESSFSDLYFQSDIDNDELFQIHKIKLQLKVLKPGYAYWLEESNTDESAFKMAQKVMCDEHYHIPYPHCLKQQRRIIFRAKCILLKRVQTMVDDPSQSQSITKVRAFYLLQYGKTFHFKSQSEYALAFFYKSLDLLPTAAANWWLCRVFMAKEEWKKALEYVRNAVRIESNVDIYRKHLQICQQEVKRIANYSRKLQYELEQI